MDAARLVDEYPRLFHMAVHGAWPSIRRHGLLSTRAIVDRWQPDADTRRAALERVRQRGIQVSSPSLGAVLIRDQLPLKFLTECLSEGTTPQQYLDALNGRVFLWLSPSRLQRLLSARAYRDTPQTVLTIDTARFVAAYADRVELAPYNTGSIHVPNLPKRGADVFTPLDRYPYDLWRAKRGPSHDAVVELTVPYAVPDIADFVLHVDTWDRGVPVERVHDAEDSHPAQRVGR